MKKSEHHPRAEHRAWRRHAQRPAAAGRQPRPHISPTGLFRENGISLSFLLLSDLSFHTIKIQKMFSNSEINNLTIWFAVN